MRVYRNIAIFNLIVFTCVILNSCRIRATRENAKPSYDDGRNGKGPALAVIGDSLSSGVLASTVLGEDPDRSLLNRFTRFVFGGGHVLDQIQGEFSELDKSCMGTDQDWGLREAIATQNKMKASDIPLIFAAQWGGRLLHIPKYLEHLKENYQARGKPAEYVAFMIGGNDLCRGITESKFQEAYEESFRKILHLHPHSTVIANLLPNFTDILKYDYVYSPVTSCERFRISYCKDIFATGTEKRIDAYNRSIRRVVGRYQRIYGGTIYLVSSFEATRLDSDDISFDCFHPSLKGQQKFAKPLRSPFNRIE